MCVKCKQNIKEGEKRRDSIDSPNNFVIFENPSQKKGLARPKV
jgi:hypothetical protein